MTDPAVPADGLPGLLAELDSFTGLPAEDASAVDTARNDLVTGSLSVARSEGPHHFTASCLLLAHHESSWSVALGLHARSGQWRQFGGHIEPTDTGLRSAARRELREEAGVDATTAGVDLSTSPVAVRVFVVGSADCTSHVDVLYIATMDHRSPLSSADPGVAAVAWWPCDSLPPGTADDLVRDLPLLLRRHVQR